MGAAGSLQVRQGKQDGEEGTRAPEMWPWSPHWTSLRVKSVLARMFAPSKDLISGIKISEYSDRYTAGAQYILAEIG